MERLSMSLKDAVKNLIRTGILTPKRLLGQHFMVDERVLSRMVGYAELSSDDVVLEIGAGLGFLTKLLAERAKLVYAVELDRRLAEYLRSRFPEGSNVRVLEGDFLKLRVEDFDKVVSNPPYAISTPMMLKLIELSPKVMVLTLQDEFSRKLCAEPGSPSYGRLTVLTALNYHVEILEHLSPSVFYPESRVRSVIVRLTRRPDALEPRRFKALRSVVDQAFSLRNKTLRNLVKRILPGFSLQYDLGLRVYRTPPEVFLEIADAVLLRGEV
ncbi:ribosomal RNA small subunit methyltransferase A [Candidatus Bathyarchaeota archaeon]|nr:ribosomal RNA small subunit methyltransferase A [Candidatus Bathyarchaeota archaeon]